MVWRISPMRAPSLAAGRSSGAGRSQNPAIRLVAASRWRSRMRPRWRTTSRTPLRRTGAVLRSLTGSCAAVPSWRARQQAASGQTRQSGWRGRQTVAPSSISAWLKWPGWRGSIHCWAISRNRARVRPAEMSEASLVTRATPRSTLPSRTAKGRSKAMLPMEAAGCGDALRGAAQVAGARVVAEAAPQGQHVVFGGGGQGCHGGEACEEAAIVRDDGLRAGLLQHDLADPDGVRIARVAPGKIAMAAGVPGEQEAADVVTGRGRFNPVFTQ